MLENITRVKGLGAYENVLLASIVAGINPILSGDTGVAKTQLCEAIGKLLVKGLFLDKGIEMDFSSIHAVNSAPENMAGMDIPDIETKKMLLFESHKSVLNSFMIFMDEISRIGDNPINQSKLLSAIAEGEIDGQSLSYYIIMGACNLNDEGEEDFQVEPLDKAFSHRFGCLIKIPSLHLQSDEDRESILEESLKGNTHNPFEYTKEDYHAGRFQNRKKSFEPTNEDSEMFYGYIKEKRKEFIDAIEVYGVQLSKYASVIIKHAGLPDSVNVDKYQGRWGKNLQSLILAYYLVKKANFDPASSNKMQFTLKDAAQEALFYSLSIKNLYSDDYVTEQQSNDLHRMAMVHLSQSETMMGKITQEKDPMKRVILALKATPKEVKSSDFTSLVGDVVGSEFYSDTQKGFFAFLVGQANTKIKKHSQTEAVLTKCVSKLNCVEVDIESSQEVQERISQLPRIVQMALKKQVSSYVDPMDETIIQDLESLENEYTEIYKKGFKKIIPKGK